MKEEEGGGGKDWGKKPRPGPAFETSEKKGETRLTRKRKKKKEREEERKKTARTKREN